MTYKVQVYVTTQKRPGLFEGTVQVTRGAFMCATYDDARRMENLLLARNAEHLDVHVQIFFRVGSMGWCDIHEIDRAQRDILTAKQIVGRDMAQEQEAAE